MDNDLPPPAPPPLTSAATSDNPPAAFRPSTPTPQRKPSAGRGWKISTIILSVILLVCLANYVASFFIEAMLTGAEMTHHSRLQEVMIENNHSSDKIAVIPVNGIITSSSMDASGVNMVQLIEDQLKMAAKDSDVKAVLLKVNTPGGEVLASDDIYNALVNFQNTHRKPVIASMGTVAASGGYYVSAPCRWIVANELTITGSIGVIMHAYNYRGLMNKVGLRPMVYKSGRFKDMLSGEKDLEKLTPAEQSDVDAENAMIAKMINETFAKFKTIIAEGRRLSSNRNQSNKDGDTGRLLSDKWESLADGRILSGKEAKEHGFVDETGDWRVAIKRAQTLAGIPNADLVTYQMPFSLGNLLGLLGKSETRSIKVDLGFDVPRLNAGLYFLAPTFIH